MSYPDKTSGLEPNKEAKEKWDKVVKIIQQCINTGKILKSFKYGILTLIPKEGKGEMRGISLLETIHKIISKIIHTRMSKAIKFCDSIHSFRKNRGTYTAIGETNLRMNFLQVLPFNYFKYIWI